jgi:glycosyltransferase involved in cell wall biosynthesis
MTNMTKLSALVVAHNEENNIEGCLSSLSFADEIVVILDKCTDQTKELASQYTQLIFEGSWDIEGDRRNFGINACKFNWIIEVDCDERVSKPLADEVIVSIKKVDNGYFIIPFDNFIGNRLVRHGWGGYFGVGAAPRLFSKNSKVWGKQRIHPSIELLGFRGVLDNRMCHYVDRNISDMIHRLDRYSTARALDLIDSGDIGTFRSNLRRIFSRFLKCYVTRKGYKEGYYGFLVALCAGLYPILSFLKATLEAEKKTDKQ